MIRLYSTLTILLCIFTINEIKSQEKMDADQIKIFLGSWLGSAYTYDSDDLVTYLRPVLIRIHSFDPSTNSVELTEIGHTFDTGTKISNPKKMIYQARFDGMSLNIIFDRLISGSKECKLTLVYYSDVPTLKASFEGDKDKEVRFAFQISKTSDDISTFVKPAQPISVEVNVNPINIMPPHP